MGCIAKLLILVFFAAARIDARLQNSRMAMMIPQPVQPANDGPVIIPVQPTAYPSQTSIVGAAEQTVEQQAQCVSWSQEHYLTFDGQMYNFKGQCTYKLVGDCADNTFNIHVRHQKGCNNTQSCHVEVVLYVGNFVVTLRHTPDGPAAFDGERPVSIPANLHGLLVERIASYVVVRSGLGFKIKWDGADAVYVEVTEELFGKTCGLCGKFDRNPHNDFTDISGKVQSHVISFAGSWKMPESEGDTCTDSRQNSHCNTVSMEGMIANTQAAQICTGLKTLPEFLPCHQFVDVFAYYESCREDVCLSGGLESAACNTFEAYFRECLRHGVHVNWRSDSFCPANCAEGMEYRTCGTSCPETCRTTLYDCEDNQCVDGCHCPEGTYLNGGECVAHASCPCVSHGVEYPPGSHINSDCNDCECVSGKWECTTEPCEATCIATGDPHYITFDGRSYDFMGDCSYTMVMNRISDETDYSIEAENQECDSSSTRQLTCTRSVTVKIGGTVLKLKQGKSVLLNGEDIVRLPHRGPGVYIETATSIFQKVTLDNGMRVLWDGVSRLYITAPPKFVGRTMGLCGTFNYNQQDDFYTKVGDIETNPIAFANKWKTDDMCADRPLVPTGEETMHPCDIYLQLKASAQQHCGQLMGSFFTDCHQFVNPQESYDRCLFDYCGSGHSVQSMCDAMSDYSLACGAKGVELDWRQNMEGCEVSCSGELVYDQCHPGCQTTCASILEGVECEPFCVEGCACPEGTVLDYEGHCVPPEECGCMDNGKHYLDGASINRGCNTCMCSKGQWACTEMACLMDAPALCPDNQVWSNCVVENQVTCKNMHLGVTSQAPITCHAGCQCRNDTVWDEEKGACVMPQNCPCYHGGQSYEQSHTIQLDCNTW
ncbi:von Willebrand factor-like [Branchiostoma lanceolatum]|uniref:von Willebrand factor-like n=1 Tax=Branchiostoma lanceolatum TaxID=7740 RepID=UPI00345351DC